MAAKPFNPELLDDFAHGRVALFLGAGVSASATTRSGKPIRTWEKFLTDTASTAGDRAVKKEVGVLVSKGDYLFACEILKEHMQEKWEIALKDEYEKIGKPSKLQKAVLDLRPRIIVTTNFDLFIENQWEKANPDATHHLQVKNGISPDCFSMFRDDKPYLVKLHGSINSFESIIFSLSDYAEKAYANWQYSSFMETLLCTHTVVFVGFSMKDAAITNLLEIHTQKFPKNRPHYAFLPDFTSETQMRIMKNHRRLFVIPYSSADNHKQLNTLLEKLRQQIAERRRLTSI
jgi:hypothetical protein